MFIEFFSPARPSVLFQWMFTPLPWEDAGFHWKSMAGRDSYSFPHLHQKAATINHYVIIKTRYINFASLWRHSSSIIKHGIFFKGLMGLLCHVPLKLLSILQQTFLLTFIFEKGKSCGTNCTNYNCVFPQYMRAVRKWSVICWRLREKENFKALT